MLSLNFHGTISDIQVGFSIRSMDLEVVLSHIQLALQSPVVQSLVSLITTFGEDLLSLSILKKLIAVILFAEKLLGADPYVFSTNEKKKSQSFCIQCI